MNLDNFTGIILAGGKSSRMGIDKSLLKINDKTLIEVTIEKLKKIFHRVIIISDKENKFSIPDVEQFEDIYQGKGPIGGIHSGLKHSDDEFNFIISCDLPLMSEQMIRYICQQHKDALVTIPYSGGQAHFLCGVYSKICLPLIEESISLESGDQNIKSKNYNYSIKKLVASLQANNIKTDELPFFNPLLFFNVNTPEDLDFIKSKINSSN